MERNMALIGFAQLDTNNNFFLTQQVHKEVLVWLAVKLWGSTSCAGLTSKVKHLRGLENTNTSRICFLFFLRRFHLLNSRLFGGFFSWAKQATKLFFWQRGLNNYNTT
jgi:hypothetical protein